MDLNFKPLFPRIICKDNTTLSIQASKMHYSTPREDNGPYTHVEVGYPSVIPPKTWAEYADGEYPSSNVYGYIPIELVNEYIELHGGVDFIKTFNANKNW